MRLIIDITMDNAAFEGDPVPEVGRILSLYIGRLDEIRLEPGEQGRMPLDVNGNTVGTWKVED